MDLCSKFTGRILRIPDRNDRITIFLFLLYLFTFFVFPLFFGVLLSFLVSVSFLGDSDIYSTFVPVFQCFSRWIFLSVMCIESSRVLYLNEIMNSVVWNKLHLDHVTFIIHTFCVCFPFCTVFWFSFFCAKCKIGICGWTDDACIFYTVFVAFYLRHGMKNLYEIGKIIFEIFMDFKNMDGKMFVQK